MENKLTWNEYKSIEKKIMEKNKKTISTFRKSMLDAIKELEIDLDMEGCLFIQDEIKKGEKKKKTKKVIKEKEGEHGN